MKGPSLLHLLYLLHLLDVRLSGGQVAGVEYDRAGVAAHAKNLANKVKGGLEVRPLGAIVTRRVGRVR